MRVLLTGAAGFIGSHLTRALLERGDEVVAVDSLLTGRAENLRPLLDGGGLTFLERDVTLPLDVPGAFDAVMHFASPASPPDYLLHPIATLDVGTLGTRNMLEVAASKRARFMLASTSEVYGDPLEHPQRESYWGNVNPVGPRSVYDEAKRCAEAYTAAYERAGLVARIVRIFNTYGEGMRPNDGRAIPNFMTQALTGEDLTVYGTGSQTRSLCYVSDLVRGILLLLDSDVAGPVNLGGPTEVTMLSLAESIRELIGGRSQLRFAPLPEDDPQQRRPDTTRARTLLGWEPQTDLSDGLRRTAQWFREILDGRPAVGPEVAAAP